MVFNIKDDKRRIVEAEELPFEIEKLTNIAIDIGDATLYAHIWVPKKALNGDLKVGTIIEYLPYRKSDFTAIRDSIRHPYYAGHGFASIRVDMRGCGDSDGVLEGEYLPQEQHDNLKVIDWIISQSWSNGKVGQIGKSWGGFNGLQIAYEQHPSMKSIITVCSTDDRYSDDVHYRGGCMMASDMNWWASTMFTYNARPQDPDVKPDWRKNWMERLNLEPNVIEWCKHQRRDEFWQHGSVCEDYSKVDIPVLAIGGWKDGYSNAVFRMMENLPNEDNRSIVGPWVHEFPDVATPGPTIGYNQIVVSWFHKYLSDPIYDASQQFDVWAMKKYNLYLQDPADEIEEYDYRPGKWVSFDKFGDNLSFHLDGTLNTEKSNSSKEISFSGTPEYGLYRGKWCPFGESGDFASNQLTEDSKSFTIDSQELKEDIELIGFPTVTMELKSDLPLANLSVRLLDLTNTSKLVSWGQLNLNKYIGTMEKPELLKVGEKYRIEIKLDCIGYKFLKGHKIRIALSTTDWPSMWPLDETPTLSFEEKDFCLALPILGNFSTVEFPKSESVKPIDREIVREESRSRNIIHDIVNNIWTIDDFSDEGERKIEGLIMGSKNWNEWKIGGIPSTNSKWELTLKKPNWEILIKTDSLMTVDQGNYILKNHLIAYENNQQVFEKDWSTTIKRDFT